MDDIEKLSEVFKALSDPTRLRLVKLMSGRKRGQRVPDECGKGPLCVNALAKQLEITQSAVSQHLRILKQAGLVRGVRHGAFIHYDLENEGLERTKNMLRKTLGGDFL
jgi:DNA-binding transcriptional ArsR family regulator